MNAKEIKELAEELLRECFFDENVPNSAIVLVKKILDACDNNEEHSEPEQKSDSTKKLGIGWSALEEKFKEWTKCCEPITFENEPAYDIADLVVLDTYVMGQKDMAKTVHKKIQSLMYERFRSLNGTDD